MDCVQILPDAADYPRGIANVLAEGALPRITALGNRDILRQRMVAFFCSVRCPGNVILRTYDLACALRDGGITVVGGFHSPMERECLALLLRGTQPLIVCPARSIERMRLPREWWAPLEQGRLLVLSPFDAMERRVTAETAQRRNAFVAALVDEVLVAYAAPGGKTEQLCREVIGWGKPLWALDSPENAHLLELGAKPVALDAIRRFSG